jgi:hypothetical protein
MYLHNNKKNVYDENFYNFIENEYGKEYRKKIEFNILKDNIRSRVSIAFKNKGYKKGSKTENILGISFKDLKIYLENQFKNNMSWQNYGKYGWHIDHIIPLSSANTEQELLCLCHYTNLQPLWAKDNLQKSNKIIDNKQLKLI